MWLPAEVCCLGSLAELSSQSRVKSESEEEDQWFKPRKYSRSWRSKLFGLLRLTKRKEGSDEEEEENKGKELLETEWTPSSRTSEAEPEPWESEIESATDLISKLCNEASKAKGSSHPGQFGSSLLEERYGHLPKFLHYFVVQNWFKRLFPIFTLEVRRLWEAGKPNLVQGG